MGFSSYRKDRKYEPSRSKRRSRSRSKDRSRGSKNHSKDYPKEKIVSVKEEEKKETKNDDDLFDPANRDKVGYGLTRVLQSINTSNLLINVFTTQEVEAKKLEEEMKKRRERIERWRAERKKKELEAIRKDLKTSICTYSIIRPALFENDFTKFFIPVANIQVPSKKWNLEDDSDEEEENKDKEKEKEKEKLPVTEAEEEVEEIDSLDAFMQEVNEEVKKVNKLDAASGENKTSTPTPSGVVIMTGVAKKKTEQKRKGELIEQNQDGLEVSTTFDCRWLVLKFLLNWWILCSTRPKKKKRIWIPPPQI